VTADHVIQTIGALLLVVFTWGAVVANNGRRR
jgi:hypothetical protein